MREVVPVGPMWKLANTIRLIRQPYAATEMWRQQYGDTYRARAMAGEVVVTGDPALAKQIFGADPSIFEPYGSHAFEPLTGRRSLFMLSGDEHKRKRKILMAPFHGPRMRAYGESIQEVAARRAATWSEGQEISVIEEATAVSAEVIVRAVFGVQSEERIDAYLELIAVWVDAWKPAYILIPILQQSWIPAWKRFLDASETMTSMLLEDITARRESGERGEDILSLLLESTYEDGTTLNDQSILDQLRSLLFAGHETTMIGVSWAMNWIHRTPRIVEPTLEAADRGLEAWARDPWLTALVQESLRMRPVILMIFRTLNQAWTLGPYELDAGTNVSVSIGMMHTRADLYPDPLEFRPERFIERKFKPWEYCPFGGGHRRCIGAALAMFEAQVVVAEWMRTTRFETAGGDPAKIVRRNLSIAPGDGVPLRIVGRR